MTQPAHNRMFVAIAGASSSGKTRVLHSLKSAIGQRQSAHLDLDGYHKHDRNQRSSLGEYPEDLEANDFAQIVADLKQLRLGGDVRVPTYDHTTGRFGSPRSVKSRPITFVEGLHAVALNSICSDHLTDISFFLDPEDDLRRSWKVHRDVSERFYTYQNAVTEIQRREPLVHKHILSQRDVADVIIHIAAGAPRLPYHTVLVAPVVAQQMRLRRFLLLSPARTPHTGDRDYSGRLVLRGVQHEDLLQAVDHCPFHLSHSAIRILSAKTRPGSFQNAIRCLVAILLANVAQRQLKEEPQ